MSDLPSSKPLSFQRSAYSIRKPLEQRIAAACAAMRNGLPIVLMDDHDRENEADLIAAAETLSQDVMARMIRDCSGIVCLCLDDAMIRQLDLPPMVASNQSRYG